MFEKFAVIHDIACYNLHVFVIIIQWLIYKFDFQVLVLGTYTYNSYSLSSVGIVCMLRKQIYLCVLGSNL